MFDHQIPHFQHFPMQADGFESPQDLTTPFLQTEKSQVPKPG